MKYIVTQRIDCVLIVPDGKQLEIDGFIFLRDIDGNNTAKYIQTEVEAHTVEEAQRTARKRVTQFLSKISIFHNSKYMLLGIVSVTDGKTTLVNKDIKGRVNVGIDGNLIKDEYVRIKNKRTRIRPLQHYSDAINSNDPFDQFRNFYLVLENYLKNRTDITNWIKNKLPTIEMKTDMYNHKITIITWIRHKLSHAKIKNEGLTPLSISNPQDVSLVQKHLPIVQNLAREIIREKENI
jgi:methylamine utilization protein MauJ